MNTILPDGPAQGRHAVNTIPPAEHGLDWASIVGAVPDDDLSVDWALVEVEEGRFLGLVRRSAWADDPDRLRNRLVAAHAAQAGLA